MPIRNRWTWTIAVLVTVGGRDVCRAAGPFAYIAEPMLNRVSVIDTAARPLAVVATIPVGNGPAGVAVHPGRNRGTSAIRARTRCP